MPLKKRKPVGLKKLKKIIGYKGPAFAQLVGIPMDTLKSIESGRMPLSRENGLKIRLATGVAEETLHRITPAFSGTGKAYCSEDFTRWRVQILHLRDDSAYARAAAEELGNSLGFWAKILLLAAVENGKEVTFKSLHLQLAGVLDEMVEKNGLRTSVDKVLERFKIKDKAAPLWTKQRWLSDDPAAVSMKPFHPNITPQKLRHLRDLDEVHPEEVISPLEWDPETLPAALKGFGAVTKSAD